MNVDLSNVDYGTLDKAKNAFIAASRKTLTYAKRYGFVPDALLGASANIFSLNLNQFIEGSQHEIFLSLVPEGLGTADDARPADLSLDEKRDFWYNIAFKTLSSLTNDAAASGLQTILVGLYLPSSTPELVFDEPFMDGFLSGFTEACKIVGCVYISGETPQLKGKIVEGRLDIAGALCAISPPGKKPIDSSRLGRGDQIVLIESSGPHENGFTVLRALVNKLPEGYRTKLNSGEEYWRAINRASKLYTPFVQTLLSSGVLPTALENITGHGFQKLMRSAKPLRYVIEKILAVPEIFTFVENYSAKSPSEMLSIFNYGAGMAVYLANENDALKTVEVAKSLGLNAIHSGYVEQAQSREVLVKPLNVCLRSEDFALSR